MDGWILMACLLNFLNEYDLETAVCTGVTFRQRHA